MHDQGNVTSCRGDEQWREFLQRTITPEEERECLRHLDRCLSCCRRLEALAAEPEEWAEVPKWLDADRALPRSEQGAPTFAARPHRVSNFSADDSAAGDSGNIEPRDALGEREGELPGANGGVGGDAAIRQMLTAILDPTDDPAMLGRLGPYEVMGVIGAGGMGLVLKAHDRALGRHVAMKVLAPHWAGSPLARRRFAREARAAAAVVHEHVIAVHAVSEVHGVPYLVMPYFPAQSLQQRIDQSAPLPLVEILRISHQIASGLAAAHAEGLIHRDIKPANILLEQGVERVVITDFGLARTADDASLTRSGVLTGTPQYMAPEQTRGGPIDHRADLFSLGSVMYTMCTGRPPFRAETTLGVLRRISDETPTPIRALAPEIPGWLDDIIRRLHAKDPANRFQTASEVAVLLKGWLAHVQNPLQIAPPRSEKGKHRRRFDFQSGLAAVLLFGMVLGAFATYVLDDRSYPPARPTDLPHMSLDDQWTAVKEMQGMAERISLRVWKDEATLIEPELVPYPIMRTFDPERGADGTRQDEGSLWIWGASGRPWAMLEMWRQVGSREAWGHALISTTTRPISAEVGSEVWTPNRPGLVFHRLDDEPRPSPFREVRAEQMLEIARNFAGWEVLRSGSVALSVQSEPIHTYSTPYLHGAMFALNHYWNPEAVLFVEATADGDESWLELTAGSADLTHWRFAAVPASSHEVHVTYRQRTVAILREAANLRGTPTDPLWVFYASPK
jgi:serine/threonine protein kinase